MGSKQTVAVIVAHPDDEVLAFGGSIAKHAADGDDVHVFIMATGLASRETGSVNEKAISALRNQAIEAAKVLGAKETQFGDFPDNRMDEVALLDVVKAVEAFAENVKPARVYTHHQGDLNVDHKIVAQAVLTAFRPLPGAKPVSLYSGEVLSSSEYADPSVRFAPTSYVDIATVLEKKKWALACYAGELRDWPHPRSIEAIEHQARLRGSESGLDAAEALRLIREIS